jgi:hypothetical protein
MASLSSLISLCSPLLQSKAAERFVGQSSVYDKVCKQNKQRGWPYSAANPLVPNVVVVLCWSLVNLHSLYSCIIFRRQCIQNQITARQNSGRCNNNSSGKWLGVNNAVDYQVKLRNRPVLIYTNQISWTKFFFIDQASNGKVDGLLTQRERETRREMNGNAVGVDVIKRDNK